MEDIQVIVDEALDVRSVVLDNRRLRIALQNLVTAVETDAEAVLTHEIEDHLPQGCPVCEALIALNMMAYGELPELPKERWWDKLFGTYTPFDMRTHPDCRDRYEDRDGPEIEDDDE